LGGTEEEFNKMQISCVAVQWEMFMQNKNKTYHPVKLNTPMCIYNALDYAL